MERIEEVSSIKNKNGIGYGTAANLRLQSIFRNPVLEGRTRRTICR